MNHSELLRRLREGPLLTDGGTGTTLVELGAPLDGCLEALNVDEPALVSRVHRAFVDAGAQIVQTNTFGANRFRLGRYRLADRVVEFNQAAVELARHDGVLVAGSVGPLGVYLAPYGRVGSADAHEAYAEQIAALVDAGVDLLSIETQSDLGEMEQALAAAREVGKLPVIVSATFTRDDRTLLGSTPQQVAARLVELEVDALGVNCSQGPAQVLRIVEAMREVAGGVPLVARPNAGGPMRVGGRLMYPAAPEYFADHVRALVAAGTSLVGGCCGTGPAHIRAMAQALDQLPADTLVEVLPSREAPDGVGRSVHADGLAERLAATRFVISAEMDPPHGASSAEMLAGAETLADAGVDVIDVADSPMARLRMSPWAACRLIQEHVGIETVLHFPTRGRNILRIQGDLLAAYALGIRNLFICLGDPASIGDYPEADRGVDVASTGLIRLVTEGFNKGRDKAGSSIGEATQFVVGCALNLDPPDLDRECRLLHRKIQAGADFALCQPVYATEVVDRFRDAYEERHGELDLPVLVGVLPPVSVRHAQFLANEVPGINVPEEVIERLRKAGPEADREGLAITTDIACALRGEAAGLYLMPPFKRYDLAAELIETVRAV